MKLGDRGGTLHLSQVDWNVDRYYTKAGVNPAHTEYEGQTFVYTWENCSYSRLSLFVLPMQFRTPTDQASSRAGNVPFSGCHH